MAGFIDRINAATFDYAREPVPDSEGRSSARLFLVWIAALINLPFLMLGVVFAQQMVWQDALIAIIAGQAIVAILITANGYIGARLKLPINVLTPLTLGRLGAGVTSLALAIGLLGWFGFQTEFFAQFLQKLLADHFSVDLDLPVLIICSGLLMTTTAVIGFKALDVLSVVATPFLILLLAIPLFEQLAGGNVVDRMYDNGPAQSSLPIGSAISMLVGGIGIGIFIAPDITRYSKTPRSAVHAMWTSNFIGSFVIFSLAIALVLLSGGSDLVSILTATGWILPMIVMFFVATWTTNDSNVYLSSMALAAVLKSFRKWVLAMVCGILGTVAALIGVMEHFVPWLMALGIVFAPAASVFMVDYFYDPERYVNAHAKHARLFRSRASISWLSGIVMGYCTTSSEVLGGQLFQLTTIPAMDSILIAGGMHFLLLKIFKEAGA